MFKNPGKYRVSYNCLESLSNTFRKTLRSRAIYMIIVDENIIGAPIMRNNRNIGYFSISPHIVIALTTFR